MARTSIERIRRQELIDATLQVIEEHGFQATTIGKISQASGFSVGIVSHYFGGKQGLLEATMRHLLSFLQRDLLRSLELRPNDPRSRLMAIVDANFAGAQTEMQSAKTWLAFWAQAIHQPELARLQRVNERRLIANLRFYLRQLIPADEVRGTAQTIAALIDGFWLRAALSEGRLRSADAERLCRDYIDQALIRKTT